MGTPLAKLTLPVRVTQDGPSIRILDFERFVQTHGWPHIDADVDLYVSDGEVEWDVSPSYTEEDDAYLADVAIDIMDRFCSVMYGIYVMRARDGWLEISAERA